MATLTIHLPDELGPDPNIKIVYDQQGQPSQVLLPYATFQKMIGLLQTLHPPQPAVQPATSAWQNQLLTLSTWSETDLDGVRQGRELINQWRPQTFS